MSKLLVLFFSLLLVGCAAAQMKTWLGSSKNDLVAKWGVPHRSERLDNGKQVLTWDARNGYGRIICTQTFIVDSYGTIEDFETNCP
jgi:hypothetical protein